MKALLQRVSRASVTIEGAVRGEISRGLLVLLGVGREDAPNFPDLTPGKERVSKLVGKILRLRIFDDAEGRMNLSVEDVGGGILVVSQFTLYADTRKGNRPSYVNAAPPEIAVPLYEEFLAELRRNFSGPVAQGEFGADMKVELLNDGPVTIPLEI